MKNKNYFKISFPSRSVNESFARMTVAAFCMQFDPTLEQLNDIKTSVSEAVTNCVVHAYPDDQGSIYITAKLTENTLVNAVNSVYNNRYNLFNEFKKHNIVNKSEEIVKVVCNYIKT